MSGEGVHGAQELVGDASRLSQAAEQSAVHRGWVVADRVLTGEEQTWDGLRTKGGGDDKHQNDKLIRTTQFGSISCGLAKEDDILQICSGGSGYVF